MKQIIRISWAGYVLSLVVAVICVVLPVIVWVTAPALMGGRLANPSFFSMYDWAPMMPINLSWVTKLYGYLLEFIPNTLIVMCWFTAASFFRSVRELSIFSIKNAKRLHRIGWFLLMAKLSGFLVQLPLSALLTWGNGVGHRQMSLSLSGSDIGLLGVALVVILASWIVREGAGIDSDNKQII